MSERKVNEMVRVLKGIRKKYTCTVFKPDGKEIEFQADQKPKLEFLNEARTLFLTSREYPEAPIMKWEDDFVLLCEENNPEPKNP